MTSHIPEAHLNVKWLAIKPTSENYICQVIFLIQAKVTFSMVIMNKSDNLQGNLSAFPAGILPRIDSVIFALIRIVTSITSWLINVVITIVGK